MKKWEAAQKWERGWHGNCANSYQEESKQIEYAKRMGFLVENRNGRYPVIDFKGQSVIDVGGAPTMQIIRLRISGHTATVRLHMSGYKVGTNSYVSWDASTIKPAIAHAFYHGRISLGGAVGVVGMNFKKGGKICYRH